MEAMTYTVWRGQGEYTLITGRCINQGDKDYNFGIAVIGPDETMRKLMLDTFVNIARVQHIHHTINIDAEVAKATEVFLFLESERLRNLS